MEKEIMQLVKKWDADAVRDSDGTALSQDIIEMGLCVYSTLCLVRYDNEFAKQNRQYLQRIYLMSPVCTAFEDKVEISVMEDYFDEQFAPDTSDIKKWWAVVDKTSGEDVDASQWEYCAERAVVTVKNAKRYHEYVVYFMAVQIWEPVSMYNHLTNSWTEEHRLPLDVRYPEAQERVLALLEDWLEKHPKTDVVRFTTFFYNFDLIYNKKGKERRVDWFGYLSCVSPYALEQFKAQYGYELTPHDFIGFGYYNNPFVNPSKKYLDWMDFNQKFVSGFAKRCVDLVHKYNKKAIMFLGDHWAGTEPYGKYFGQVGLDAVVGAAGDGVTTRMIADIPVKQTEARFYPYFFPDTFHEGADPVRVSNEIWFKCRRAILQKPMKRMGYGGYLSLVVKFPDFLDHVADIRRQFSQIWDNSEGERPGTASFKVGILSSWGKIRTWMTHQVAHSLFNKKCYSYLGIMEALAGFSVELEFLSFEDILEKGIPEDVGVIINAGDAYTSWSGGEYWGNERVLEIIREFVASGGGFIGVGEPSAFEKNGSYFQLYDVLGVQKEVGFTLNDNKPGLEPVGEHFITADFKGESFNKGESVGWVYKAKDSCRVLFAEDDTLCLGVNAYGKGRSVYFSGLPFSFENARLLLRAIFWAAGRERELLQCFSENPATDCVYYPKAKLMAVANNSDLEQETVVWLPSGKKEALTLQGLELRWIEV